jgi:hypothetical protein
MRVISLCGMAGRKQHFIQKHLLRGFVADPAANHPHVWVYRHDGKLFFPSLNDYAAERDFYGNSDLDDKITKMESVRINEYISFLRTGEDRDVGADEAAMFAVHVFARSKSIRSMVTDSIEPLMDRSMDALRSVDFQARMLLSEIRRNPTLMVKAMSPEYSSFEHFARIKVEQRHADTLELLEKFRRGLRAAIAEGQNKILNAYIECEGGRRDFLSQLRWRRVSIPEPQLILGDSVVFAEMRDGSVKPVHEPNDELANVWLPLSSNLVLVGSSGEALPVMDVDRINVGSASCSYDAFCALDGKKHANLIGLIRRKTFTLSRDQMDEIVSDSLDKMLE